MTSDFTFAVLLGGALRPDARVGALTRGVRAIAADGGMAHAAPLGLAPELWVGDFDSAPKQLLAQYCNTPRLPFPAEKNFTDGELAIEQAIDRGAKRLILVGAFAGARTDHALIHLLQAVSLAERGFDVVMTSGEEEAVVLLPGVQCLELPVGSLLSVIAIEPLRGLSLSGVKYPLDDADIHFAASRTVSNVVGSTNCDSVTDTGVGEVHISLQSGRALVLVRPHDFSGN